ncbi:MULTISPECIES: helix-turn-helix transcriptional regulator [unclassified Arsenophonus]|uniref:helix-turn-helix transcriptional regulator n=1 Tax=unclassified Arsenophonus TaxID=2627083 RepID=UPI002856C72B|nr:helix-turn-helix transcriptional regulator [Arsenophonus sp.]MDR5611272.1 helix-turn-helix transcriptional regulator [Arsenophonus sp.]MDR5615288.1 helix-turn-helix transcriptional regulator [Arsenophonus sp.]
MNNLKKLRKQAGMTQARLANALGLTQGAVAHYEKGIRRLNIDIAKKILSEFNSRGIFCTFEDVFSSRSYSVNKTLTPSNTKAK